MKTGVFLCHEGGEIILNKTTKALNQNARKNAESLDTASRIVAKTRVKQIAEDTAATVDRIIEEDGVILNDGNAPAAPTGIAVEPVSRGLTVTWDIPPHDDWVERSVVEITQLPSGPTTLTDTADLALVKLGLAKDVAHRVRVKHVDRWGLESGFSAAVEGTPLPSVADAFDEELQIDAERILGQFGVEQLPDLSGPDAIEKLVGGVRGSIEALQEQPDPPRFISADIVAAFDVAAVNALFSNLQAQDALFEKARIAVAQIDEFDAATATIAGLRVTSAQVVSLAADKIIAGQLKANLSIVSGGTISTEGVLLDPDGITLTESGSEIGYPFQNDRRSWMVPKAVAVEPGLYAGLSFFNDTVSGANNRGTIIVGVGGAGTSKGGVVRLVGASGDNNSRGNINTAVVTVVSGNPNNPNLPGRVILEKDVIVQRDMQIDRDLFVSRNLTLLASGRLEPQIAINPTTLDPGQTVRGVAPGINQIPRMPWVQVSISGLWRGIGDGHWGVNFGVTNGELVITNNHDAPRTVRGYALL